MSPAASTTVTLTLDPAEWTAVRDLLADRLRQTVEGRAVTLRDPVPGVWPGTIAPTVIRLLEALTAIVDSGALGPVPEPPP